jgi:hypothetical protein
MSTIPVFVTLGGGQPVIIGIPRDAFVGHLVDAIIAKLKLEVTADMVLLRFAPSASGEPGLALNPRNKLYEAGVGERSDLVIEVIDTSPVGGCINVELSLGLPGRQRGQSLLLNKRLVGAQEGLSGMGQRPLV